ncbi:MAG: VOC family protein [Candidatus Thorarchaeota archaeon]
MKISAINSVLIYVRNVENTIEFYKDILELPLVHSHAGFAQFALKDTNLLLHQMPSSSEIPPSQGRIHFNFEVENLAESIQTLRERNVRITKDLHDGGFGYLVASILDPEDNELDLLERISKAEN